VHDQEFGRPVVAPARDPDAPAFEVAIEAVDAVELAPHVAPVRTDGSERSIDVGADANRARGRERSPARLFDGAAPERGRPTRRA